MGTRRRLRQGHRCRGPGARRRTAWCAAGAVAKLAGSRPARPPARIGPRNPRHRQARRSPRVDPRVSWSGAPGPLGTRTAGAEWARSQGAGAQAALPPGSPAWPQRSFWLGWSPGPVEPARGRRRREAETSSPLCPLLSAFLSPALLEVASRIPQEWVGRENHSPGLGGKDQRVPGGGLSPRWGLALGTLGSRCRGNDRWSD